MEPRGRLWREPDDDGREGVNGMTAEIGMADGRGAVPDCLRDALSLVSPAWDSGFVPGVGNVRIWGGLKL
jgi:hypothetical protein